jgi:hypothetical protein
MPTPRQVNLAHCAQQTAMHLKGALAWYCSSKDPAIADDVRAIKDLRRSIFLVNRLANAALTKMCVGVYGPSQAGKSYLVTALAQANNQRFFANFGGKNVDFIESINPEGGNESTGLVTRLTVDKRDCPTGYPIAASLLTEMDLVKILINSYVNDIVPDADDSVDNQEQQITTLLAELGKLTRSTLPSSHGQLSSEDIYDLEEHCSNRFRGNSRLQALKRLDFWEQAAELIPHLSDQDRAKVFEIIWECLPEYTNNYRMLVENLRKLNFTKNLYCSPEALFNVSGSDWSRTPDSVINVASLRRYGTPADLSVAVCGDDHQPQQIRRSILCALIAEITVPMRDKPHAFFDEADLLDFPGARSRVGTRKVDLAETGRDPLGGLYLRGKVAYLFDKYTENLELSAMLLCADPQPLAIDGLAIMVEDWIMKTHGQSFEDRSVASTALFLILTKFDMQFSQGAGVTNDGTRWTNRLHASLIEPFGEYSPRTGWVNQWDQNGPFRNTYWLRNPNFGQFGLIEYAGDPGSSAEVGLNHARDTQIDGLRLSFLSNELVRRHFKNPTDAWEAGLALNDGGITYIVRNLTAVCNSNLKTSQLEQRLASEIQDRISDLSRHYISDNLDDVASQKREFALKIVGLGVNLFERQRIGEFVNFLSLDTTFVREIFIRVRAQTERERNVVQAEETGDDLDSKNRVSAAARRMLARLKVPNATNTNSPIVTESTPIIRINSNASRSFPDKLVATFLSEWKAEIMQRLSDNNVTAYLHIRRDRELVRVLLNELEIAANRVNLPEKIKRKLLPLHAFGTSSAAAIEKQSAMVAAVLNTFISFAGCLPEPLAQSVEVDMLDGTKENVFVVADCSTDGAELSEVASDFSESYFADWLASLQSTIQKNAQYANGLNFDREQNQLLQIQLSGLREDLKLLAT